MNNSCRLTDRTELGEGCIAHRLKRLSVDTDTPMHMHDNATERMFRILSLRILEAVEKSVYKHRKLW